MPTELDALEASCLCGAVAWRVSGRVSSMSHCHCSRCRKAHGSPYATYVSAPAEHFAFERGRDTVVVAPSSAAFARAECGWCGRCGSVVPDGAPRNGRVGMPAGGFDGDPGVVPEAHIFVGSKAPWHAIADELPRFDAFPSGVDLPVLPDPQIAGAAPAGGARGSCLCGGVAYVVVRPFLRCRTCHCARCRKASAAANVTYLVTALGGVRVTRGEHLLATFVFHVPGARPFRTAFCSGCGSRMPDLDTARGIAVVPMGSLDDDPGIRSERHIFVGSRAPWDVIGDELPQDEAAPA